MQFIIKYRSSVDQKTAYYIFYRMLVFSRSSDVGQRERERNALWGVCKYYTRNITISYQQTLAYHYKQSVDRRWPSLEFLFVHDIDDDGKPDTQPVRLSHNI